MVYLGIEADYIIDYESAIKKLIENGYCNYYSCLFLSSESYAELPIENIFKRLNQNY